MDVRTYYLNLAAEWIVDASRHAAAGYHILADECRNIASAYQGMADAHQ